jgi:hypothetical protein
MEKSVTDPDVKKVIMICDKAYAEKADKRKGGVGTETQIISPEVYGRIENNTKFLAVIREKDEKGNHYRPAYLKSRIFIDMSDDEAETKNFEQLLRWVFDKPLHQRPELGKPPSFIFEESTVSLGTSSKHRYAIDSIKQNKAGAAGAVRDYFETFAENLFQLKIEPEGDSNFEERILQSIDSLTPFRDEVIEVCLTITKYSSNPDIYRELHRFFELLLPYIATKPIDKNQWVEGENDNFRFIVHELFLYVVAVLVKYEKFAEAGDLLSQIYYSQQLARIEGFQTNAFDYSKFNTHFLFYSLQNRNDRELLQSNLFRNRATRRDVTLEDIMQSDFLLYLYSLLHLEGYFAHYSWYPYTNAFAIHRSQPFEVFSKSQSIKYFDRLKKLLIIDSKTELTDLIEKSNSEKGYIPGFGVWIRVISPGILMNINNISTKP